MNTFLIRTALALALGATAGQAQSRAAGDYSWGVQFGTVNPLGKASKVMDTGYTATWDFTYYATPALGLRTEVAWAQSRANIPYNTQGIGASVQSGSLTENVVVPLTRTLPVELSFIGGVGAYRVTGQVDRTVLVPGAYWDPWWGIWYPGMYGATQGLASRTTTKFGANAGIGIAFRAFDEVLMTLEVRYTRIETSPTIEYLPITLGVRF